jgi:DNA recombination protein Rad52
MRVFTEEDRTNINAQLQQNLDRDDVSHRQAHSGSLAYVEGYRVIELANSIFGFDGWSCDIREMTEDFVTQAAESKKWSAGYSCTVRVTLANGVYREDIGYGESQAQPQQGAAREIARKSASTDALKRALRLFGRALGLCLYDAEFRTTVGRKTSAPGAQRGTVRPPAIEKPAHPIPPLKQHVPMVHHAPHSRPAMPPIQTLPPLNAMPTMAADSALDSFEFSIPDNFDC